MGECGLGSSGSGQRSVAGSDVNGNELSDTKKGGGGDLLINRVIITTTVFLNITHLPVFI
jgi:hypothetical protein